MRSSIILLSKPRSSRWSVFLRSRQQNPLCTFPVSHTCYMPRPSRCFDHPNNIWWSVQIVKLLVMWSSPVSLYFIRLMPNCLSCHHMLEHCQPTLLPRAELKGNVDKASRCIIHFEWKLDELNEIVLLRFVRLLRYWAVVTSLICTYCVVFRVFALLSSSCGVLYLYFQCFIAFLSITVTAEAGCLPVFLLACGMCSLVLLIDMSYWPWCWFVRLVRKIAKKATVWLVRPSVRMEQFGTPQWTDFH